MPRVWSTLPETKLWIVGKNPPSKIQQLGVPWCPTWQGTQLPVRTKRDQRIQITGTVEDIRPFLRKATLAVAPIRYGVGIQNKVLEAMACGTPVVATDTATAALRAESGRDLEIARNDQGLADCITSLLKNQDHRQNIGKAGRSFVERQHDWRHIVQDLTAVYQDARRQTPSA